MPESYRTGSQPRRILLHLKLVQKHPSVAGRKASGARSSSPVVQLDSLLPSTSPVRLGERIELTEPSVAGQSGLVPGDVDWMEAELPALSAAESEATYELHLAALEWALDPTILIHSAEDIKARVHWKELKLEPFEHQVQNLITFCRRAPVALIADDVGLGKTISAGLILSELRVRGAVNRCLVLAPTALGPQWTEELRVKFGIHGEDAVGQELMAAATGPADVVVTSYHSARSRMTELASEGFDMLVLDEVHGLRNLCYPGNKPPGMATAVRDALEARAFKYVLMLTATPIQNRLWDLYSLIDMLAVAKGHQNPLGTQHAFVDRYIADSSSEARRLHPGREREFRRHLSQYMVRTRREDCDLPFPERQVQLVRAQPSPGELDLFRLVARLMDGLNKLLQTSVAQALMSSPQALLAQLENTAAVGWSETERVRRSVSMIEATGKETGLLRLLRGLKRARPEDWRVVIFTGRKETQRRLREVIESEFGPDVCGLIAGGRAEANQRAIADYWEDPPRCHVIVSTNAGAEGVNLQKGNVVVNYDLPWNPMILEQRIGRVQRLGSEHANVSVLNLVLAGSVEERVVGRLQEKLTVISATIGDIEGVLENVGPRGGDSGSFEAVIRDLVVMSLQGRDVEADVQRQLASIDRAKQIYEEEKQAVEEHLGQMDAMHSEGPPMPKLSQVRPRMSEPEFTLAALQAGGSELRRVSHEYYERIRSGDVIEVVCFDPAATRAAATPRGSAGGRKAALYRSGQPAFERLVSGWTKQSHAFVKDLRGLTPAGAEQVVSAWFLEQQVDVKVDSVVLGRVKEGFHGDLVVRGAVNVAHDKYEKLVGLPVATSGMARPPADVVDRAPVMQTRLDPHGASSEVELLVRGGLVQDADLAAFCGFYLRRREEEIQRARGKEVLLNRARQDFTPTMSAHLVGARGVAYGVVAVQASVRHEGGDAAMVAFTVRSWGQVETGPDLQTCSVTGARSPSQLLARCSVTGALARRHVLVRSEASGKLAVPSEAGRCEVSGVALLKSELGTSVVSGRDVDARLLVASQVSGKAALPEEMSTCEVTGQRCLAEELLTSEVSGRKFAGPGHRAGGEPQVMGHPSEFEQCSASMDWFPEDQMGWSDVTGKAVAKAHLSRSEKPPGRMGESVGVRKCAVSGLHLLRDEVEICAVTGDSADRDLLATSAMSGRRAVPQAMVACEESGDRVLPNEVRGCELTGKIVRRDRLKRSEASGRMILETEMESSAFSGRLAEPDRMVVCGVSGDRVLADEVFQCPVSGRTARRDLFQKSDVTGQMVLKSELSRSAESGRHAEPEHMAVCEVSGDPILRDELIVCDLTGKAVRPSLVAASDVSGRVVLASELQASAESSSRGLPDEMVACAWDGQLRVPADTGRCRLTHLIVGKQYLCGDRSLAPLLDLADDPGIGHPFTSADLRGRKSPVMRKLQKLKDPSALATPDARGVLIVGERPGFLGLGRHTAFYLLVEEEVLAEGRLPR